MTKLTPNTREKFLAVLAETASVTRAAEAVRVSRQALYQARSNDEDFARRWSEAQEMGTDALEDEAIRRAREGMLKPVYQQGREVGQIREFSDTLMVVMLKARRPERYKDRTATELTGKDGAPIQHTHQHEVVEQATNGLAAVLGQLASEKRLLN